MGYSQAELGPLPVLGGVQTDAVHLQPSGDFQQLVVRDCRSLSPAEDTTLINPFYCLPGTKIFASLFTVCVGEDFWTRDESAT